MQHYYGDRKMKKKDTFLYNRCRYNSKNWYKASGKTVNWNEFLYR